MRILLADGAPSTRFALSTLLQQQPGWIVAGEVSASSQLQDQIDASLPEVLLLDWSLPGLKGDETVSLLKVRYPVMAVIVMSGRPEIKKQALSAGADAFVSKTEPPDKLLGAISSVYENGNAKLIP